MRVMNTIVGISVIAPDLARNVDWSPTLDTKIHRTQAGLSLIFHQGSPFH